MKSFTAVLVFIGCHPGIAVGGGIPIRMISDGARTAAFVERKVQADENLYQVRICQTNGQELTQETATIESIFIFTKGYCTDNFIALTNTGTNENPAMCVFDLKNDTVMMAEASFDITSDSISTWRISKRSLTSEGCILRNFREWHRDDWAVGESVLYLRLGDVIPNRCPVQWEYDSRTRQFTVSKTEYPDKRIRYEIRQYPVRKVLISKSSFYQEPR